MTTLTKVLLAAAVAIPIAGMVAGSAIAQEPATLTVQVDKPGHKISPSLYGIFFEEINCAGDGGIYAELVRNRSFEDSDKPDSWGVTPLDGAAPCTIDTASPSTPSPFNTRSLKVEFKSGTPNGVVNEGYWGISLIKGEKYDFSVMVKSGGFKGPLQVKLAGKDGKVYAQGAIDNLTDNWKQYKLTLTANGTDPKAQLEIVSTQAGTVWLDVVSLFPQKTWKNRPNGLRPDLAEMLNALKPSFTRFPGGCWVEGSSAATSMRWKQTIGPISDRRTLPNLWGYMSPNGLGFHEYLQMCEDLSSQPLFVINCGMSHGAPIPMDKMGEFVQDAIDAIEYANGPATSKWGQMRAKAGHPKPFGLGLMEIGNENGGRAYFERWPLFYDAIKAKYPEMKLIANTRGDYGSRKPDIIDEHYYTSPESFMQQATQYDSYDRNGPKIYVGEYACTQGSGQGNLRAALGEAAFMTGMERNSDIVVMSSYAPLFVNVNHRAWNPDLIDFDSSRVYGIPSYYVQQMLSLNRGDVTLPVEVPRSSTPAEPTHGAVGVGTWTTQAEYKDIVVTQGDKVLYKSDFAKGSEGWKFVTGNWKVEDGVLKQSSRDENCRAVVGDPSWTDYTITLKARKTGGGEGFLVLFRVASDNGYAWWNIGGWGNSRHAIEWARSQIGRAEDGSIQTDKWYDVKVEVGDGGRIKCYLDGKLIHDVALPTVNPLYASASRDSKTGDIILKVVNVAGSPQDTQMNLAGARSLDPKAEVTVLTSESGYDENSIEQPRKVYPKKSTFDVKAAAFDYTFPANSLTVFRFKEK